MKADEELKPGSITAFTVHLVCHHCRRVDTYFTEDCADFGQRLVGLQQEACDVLGWEWLTGRQVYCPQCIEALEAEQRVENWADALIDERNASDDVRVVHDFLRKTNDAD